MVVAVLAARRVVRTTVYQSWTVRQPGIEHTPLSNRHSIDRVSERKTILRGFVAASNHDNDFRCAGSICNIECAKTSIGTVYGE